MSRKAQMAAERILLAGSLLQAHGVLTRVSEGQKPTDAEIRQALSALSSTARFLQVEHAVMVRFFGGKL